MGIFLSHNLNSYYFPSPHVQQMQRVQKYLHPMYEHILREGDVVY